MEVVSRCLYSLFLVLTLVCESVTIIYCEDTNSGYQYYCDDGYYCCNENECCYTEEELHLQWWFWVIVAVTSALTSCCCKAMLKRCFGSQDNREARPAYGSITASPSSTQAGANHYPQPAPNAPVSPPKYTQPQKPPPYQ
ncbi:WW domain binding protein 1-like isoform X2 [Crassostrea angulata]|uniref:WW domain binding protein 1-like isoform X2 n=1 Tax=Magallana angulata TaxID=2784310 RepID=UPI0005C370F2|nr:WW domain binding protein 1-like isoform X2 [Crassostrea angulata]|eukprot:XP_011445927.1 PREDICTED: WW domain binding protein 1-like isoform X1 [Crassostrea gigas]